MLSALTGAGAGAALVGLVAAGHNALGGGMVDMSGLGVGLWYGATGGMLYWET